MHETRSKLTMSILHNASINQLCCQQIIFKFNNECTWVLCIRKRSKHMYLQWYSLGTHETVLWQNEVQGWTCQQLTRQAVPLWTDKLVPVLFHLDELGQPCCIHYSTWLLVSQLCKKATKSELQKTNITLWQQNSNI